MAHKLKTIITSTVILIAFLTSFTSCGENEKITDDPGIPDSLLLPEKDTLFLKGVPTGLVENPALQEASGIAFSGINENAIWSHNDSGDKARLFLLGLNGEDLGEFNLEGVTNRDWEDIAAGPGPEDGIAYLYIAEMGDNNAIYKDKFIYRIKEPDISDLNTLPSSEITGIDKIEFSYPDGNRDAETLMIDPITKDLYIISKRESDVNIYLLAYPYSTTEVNILEKVGTLPFTNVVAGDISVKGDEILVKTYSSVYCWRRVDDSSIATTLSEPGIRLPYSSEPQGEAIAWKSDGSGYYTLSEEPRGIEASLFFYKRKE
ncbi:hypothetical protein QQ008_11625 [Fulvivirgaceae bacterium BMA10]|uniref:PE-PGRS family protein n=1 Tax=Splendidivirga corallicola TaxID=3051826 RepID=A0ABT8KMS4_9BACT|nr:hypothetical protein [Fulvivirgaceae bacterium BMA10]